MSVIFEALFGFLIELLFEVVGELLVEFGFHTAADVISHKVAGNFLLALAYGAFGGVLGWISLFFFPRIIFENKAVPITFYVVSAIAAGFALSIVSWFINRDIRPVRLIEWNKFVFGILFATGYSLTRVIFG
jgi:hypothetical protein